MAQPLQFAMSRHKHCYRLHLNTLRRWEPLIGPMGSGAVSGISMWATIWLTIFIKETIISLSCGSFSDNRCRRYCPTLQSRCRLMDHHSHSVREDSLKWIRDFPLILRYLRDDTIEIIFFLQLFYSDPWIFFADHRLLDSIFAFSSIWMSRE